MKKYFKPVLLDIGGGSGPVIGGETGLGIPEDNIVAPSRSLANPVGQVSFETMTVLGEVDTVDSSGLNEIVEFDTSEIPEMGVDLADPLP